MADARCRGRSVCGNSHVPSWTLYPSGIGSEFVNSVTNRDYTMIMALTILFGSFIIIVNILTDLLVAFIDPRVKLEKKAS